MTDVTFKNHFLIAMPSQEDAIFSRSVIFLCEHGPDGAMGLIINRLLSIKLPSILEHLDIDITSPAIKDVSIYMGGPVSQESGFIIHTPYREDELNEDLVISASKETLADIAQGNGPEHYIVTLGYAAWEAGQLETELNHNDWLLVPYEKEIIFNTLLDQRWQKAIELLGITVDQLSSQTGRV